MNAEQLLYAAAKAGKLVGTNMIDKMKNDANNGGANAVAGAAATKDEQTDEEKATNLLLGILNNMKEGK